MSNILKQLLTEILNEANEEGHNAESEYNRELFAEFLISHGVCIVSCDLAQTSSPLDVVSRDAITIDYCLK